MPKSPLDEERIIRLEELAYFQEEKLKNLDAEVAALQKRLEVLERGLKKMSGELRSLREIALLANQDKRPQEVELPPHYQEKPW